MAVFLYWPSEFPQLPIPHLNSFGHVIKCGASDLVICSVRFGLCCLMTPGLSKDVQCHV